MWGKVEEGYKDLKGDIRAKGSQGNWTETQERFYIEDPDNSH